MVIDLGGIRSHSLRRFHVTDVLLVSDGDGGRQLEIAGRGSGGRIELELPRDTPLRTVELAGMTGRWEVGASRLTLTQLEGSGRIVIRLGGGSARTGDP